MHELQLEFLACMKGTVSHTDTDSSETDELAAMLRGSRPGVQSASLIMTSSMTS